MQRPSIMRVVHRDLLLLAAGIVFAAVRSEKTRRGSRIHEIFLQEMKRAMASVNACRF